MVAEIHLAKIYFTDASNFKVRPVLLLKLNSFNDWLYMPLTSNLNINGVIINEANLQEGYLPKISVIVYQKLSVISSGLLIKKIGTLENESFQNVISEFIRFIQ
ncbi:MAG TPA: type II toxin-antitoxin system PemK/MazF family toxin [Hanamia sp.]|jgi:mRNA interferase MazF|nr:type II toxin-antitoxin system PemK/MazF family toxin [Hanamia sp.]